TEHKGCKLKIRCLKVSGFRCLTDDFQITFEDDLTVIVGENDSGKTTLLECLKVVTQNKSIELDDFNYDSNKIEISVEIDDFIFKKVYEKSTDRVCEESFSAKPTDQYLDDLRDKLTAANFDISVEENIEFIRNTARMFGIAVRSNSNIQNLENNILARIILEEGSEELVIENVSFPEFNNIQLDGKQFENIPGFFKEVFLKEKQASIWKEEVHDGQTVAEFVKSKIEGYSNEITDKISEKGILDRIKLFLKDLTDIKVEPLFQPRDLNIDAKVKFLEDGKEINLDKKGDGTKRRITMALLEFKKEESLLSHDETTVYLLDEPDTHLHVKAQLDLMKTMESFAEEDNQVIITTHSPFIINSVNPKQIRMLENKSNISSIRYLNNQADGSNRILKSLGIENTYLFFARHLIVVEGETEAEFIPAYYLKKHGRMAASNLVKVINTQGITNIPGFTQAILELHDPEKIYLVFDNEATPELRRLIDLLNIPAERKFIVGEKEFEDSIDSNVLCRCWCEYLGLCGYAVPESWSAENIENLKSDARTNAKKFSKGIRALNTGSGKRMTKRVFGRVLGEYINEDELPQRLVDIFDAIN
ncbi:MAG: AAA family ATPase, partial [Candidatus Aquicultor sp.]|nr:AAA family ATPase [Candidatus Aquicultor sp.]